MFMIPKVSKMVAAAGSRLYTANNLMKLARSFSQITYGPSQAFLRHPAPAFKAPAVVDNDITTISLDDYKGKYVVLFFYPKDFTFVCPTEIIAFSDRAEEFEKLNTKLIACSCDTVESHLAWIKTPRKKGGLGSMKIPIIGDNTKEIASKYGVLVNDLGVACRGLFIINPQGVIEQITMNNLPVGRSVDETLRLIQAFQFVAEHGEVCPANWKPGDKTINPKSSLDYFESGATESPADEHLMGKDVVEVKTEKQFKELVASTKNLVVDFYAPWCGKCKMIAPFYNKLAGERKNVTFASVDTTDERLEKFSADFGVKHIPSFHFFRDGKEVGPEITGYKKQLITKQVDALFN